MTRPTTRISAGLMLLWAACVSATADGAELIPFGSNWAYLHPNGPSDNPSSSDADFDTTWFRPNYNTNSPVAWNAPAPGPFSRGSINAFDPDSSSFEREANTLLTERDSGNRLTAYFRHEFNTAEETSGFSLDLLADDGARIYLDGNEVLSVNCCLDVPPGQPTGYEDRAITVGNERAYSSFRILDGQTLSAGDHVLAVAIHNRSATDSDLGFSLRFTEGLVDFVTAGEQWQYYEGLDEPANGTLDWTTPGFDDSSWQGGQEPFGYEESGAGDPNGVFDMVDPATLLDMQDSYTSLYLRKSFSASQIDELGELTLTMDYDDAFFAYINGQLVFSSEATHPLDDPSLPIPFDLDGVAAGFDHESSNNSAALPDRFTARLADFPGLLNEGDNNVLAIQGFNRAADSSDFLLAKIALYGTPGSTTPEVSGDFDGDGQLTATDIDDLSREAAGGLNPPGYDLDGNSLVNGDDMKFWIRDLYNSWVGDANLDGEFSSSDLVTVLTAGTYETGVTAVWTTGDFTGDGLTTTADLVAALTDGGYEIGPRAAVATVPEPTGLALFMMGGLGLLRRRRAT